ncbi:alpha/beta hydrolase [Endomicrobium proavitum]|uniref:Acetyl esterase n=1 Tax=Endomicrobium proavitum TaxID=1408281 RepID=A0A0G3WGP6_9BACT|nr:alpha/beta hydrolase [Endomicrobium proavitum]AKL97851.1 Acetyl esterase [Endomicrobium proavitum]
MKKILVIISALIVFAAGFYFFTPYPAVWLVKHAFSLTKYTPPENYSEIKSNVIFHRNINYNSAYPNGKLDIIQPKNGKNDKVILWVHGGGYVGDDKKKIEHYMAMLANSGFTVVSINYALAPKDHYPVQLKQIEEAYNFIKENAATYDFNVNKIYFGGDSAGAQLVAQFINIETNPDYGAKINSNIKNMQINAVVNRKTIMGVILFCGPYNLREFLNPPPDAMKLPYKQIGWAYFGTKNVNDINVKLSNITNKLSSNYPPVFITDGNTNSFEAQAKKLEAALKENGIYVRGIYYPKSDAILEHEYQFYMNTEYAKNTYKQLLQFLNRKK